MEPHRALAAVGLGALAVATVAFAGALLLAEPARPVARTLLTTAYLAFVVGAFALAGAIVLTGSSAVVRRLRRAFPPD